MTARPIGIYVHHHGAGHRSRALEIARAMPGRFVLLGTGLSPHVGDIPHVDLPDDRQTGQDFAAHDGQSALHYFPRDHAGIRARVARIAGWIDAAAPALMLVDVSVEVAMLARLASVPAVVVRLSGLRDDAAHREAFAHAAALLSPFAAALEDPATAPDLVARTRYAPGLSPRLSPAPVDPHRVTVVLGSGGDGGGGGDAPGWIARAARATPDRNWYVLGRAPPGGLLPDNLRFAGWVDDVPARIAASGTVIGSAGDGVVSAAIQARRPFVCLPEPRPYDEQQAKAAALARAGAAIVADPAAVRDWPTLIAEADTLDPAAAAALDDPDGPARTARWLCALADEGQAA